MDNRLPSILKRTHFICLAIAILNYSLGSREENLKQKKFKK